MKALSILSGKSNCAEASFLLLTTLKVTVTFTTLEKDLENHPDYPSLLSVSDVLTGYGVNNITIKSDIEKLKEMPVPFIAQIKGQLSPENQFAFVRSVSDHHVSYFDPEKHQWTQVSKEDFEKQWPSGIVLLVDAEGAKGENNFSKKRMEEIRINFAKYVTWLVVPVLTIIAGAVLLLDNGISALYPVVFSIFTLAGCITGGLLIWYEVDQYNPVIQQICGAGRKVNCHAILNSKASKIWGVSWSSIGFTYFTGAILTLLFTGINNAYSLFLLSWFNLLALPYVFFSVYFQWRIAKQWCLLCLIVQGLLVLQFITTLLGGWHSLVQVDTTHIGVMILPIVLSYTIPFIIINLLLPGWRAAKENKRNKSELQRLKHNPQVFDTLLAKQKIITQDTRGLGITLGNPEATHKIIKVCSPYCAPCAKAHVHIEELLSNNPDVQIQIIFTTVIQDGNMSPLPVRHLLAIAEKNDESLTKQALNDWYLPEKKIYETFAAKYRMNGELKMQEHKLDAMRQWCIMTQVMATPTFFVNGYQLPKTYNVSDLKYLLSI